MTEPEADKRTSPQPVRPNPARYWWFKRILVAVGVLILALAVLRWWWGYEAERRLQAKIDEYHAAGQPVTLEDFQFPPVPDEDNAAYFLMQAASKLVSASPPDEFVEDLYSHPALVSEHADAVGRWIEANADTLRLVRAARSKQKVDWQLRFTSPVINMLLPQLSPQRRLAKFLCTTALFQHQQGDDAAAIETLRDVRMLGDTLGQMRGILIAHLVVVAIDALAIDSVESIAPTLRVTDGPEFERAEGVCAAPEQVRTLIDELLNEEPLHESWRWALCGERLMQLDTVDLVLRAPGSVIATGGGGPPPRVGWLFRPAFQLDAVLMMEFTTAAMQAGLASDDQTARALIPRYPSFETKLERYTHLLSSILFPSFERAIGLRFRGIAMRRMAAIALAIRLYELEHGHRPGSLSQLVPEYLPVPPSDPFTPDGRKLGYAPNARHPVLYSVGVDGVDDGGEFALTERGGVDRDVKDLVFFLNGGRPRAPPRRLATQPTATHAVEDYGDIQPEGGQDN